MKVGAVGDLFDTGEEAYCLRFLIIRDNDTCELEHLIRQRFGIECRRWSTEQEAVVCGAAETQAIAVQSVGKERHGGIGIGRFNHHVDGEGVITETAVHRRCGVGLLRSVEVRRSVGGGTGLVSYSHQLEVVVLVQPVAGYRFRESEIEMFADTQNAIGGFGVTEDDGRARIFHAADDG